MNPGLMNALLLRVTRIRVLSRFLLERRVELFLDDAVVGADGDGGEVDVPDGVVGRGDGGEGRLRAPLVVDRADQDPAEDAAPHEQRHPHVPAGEDFVTPQCGLLHVSNVTDRSHCGLAVSPMYLMPWMEVPSE